MKFANLHPAFRTLLAALGNADGMLTDALSRCVNITPAQAAHDLCAMRKLGLIYSCQLRPGRTKCIPESRGSRQCTLQAKRACDFRELFP